MERHYLDGISLCAGNFFKGGAAACWRRPTVNAQANYEKAVFAKTSRTLARGEGWWPSAQLPCMLISGAAHSALSFTCALHACPCAPQTEPI